MGEEPLDNINTVLGYDNLKLIFNFILDNESGLKSLVITLPSVCKLWKEIISSNSKFKYLKEECLSFMYEFNYSTHDFVYPFNKSFNIVPEPNHKWLGAKPRPMKIRREIFYQILSVINKDSVLDNPYINNFEFGDFKYLFFRELYFHFKKINMIHITPVMFFNQNRRNYEKRNNINVGIVSLFTNLKVLQLNFFNFNLDSEIGHTIQSELLDIIELTNVGYTKSDGINKKNPCPKLICPKLKKIIIKNADFNFGLETLNNCPKLEDITIEEVPNYEGDFPDLSKLLKLENLNLIKIKFNGMINEISNPKLETLILENISWNDKNKLPKFPKSIKFLKIEYNEFQNSPLESIDDEVLNDSFAECYKLRSLRLVRFTNIIGTKLYNLFQSEELKYITLNGFKNLIGLPCLNESLESFEMVNSKILNLDFLKNTIYIKELDLLASLDLKDITQLKYCTYLEKLNIKGCKKIENFEMLKKLINLNSLDISSCDINENNKIDPKFMFELGQTLKKCYKFNC